MSDLPLVVAMTGGSGSVYGRRLLEVLLRAGREVHFAISPAACEVLSSEMGVRIEARAFDPRRLVDAPTERLCCHDYRNLSAGIASGSFRTAGMCVVPCSMSTLASIANGLTTNLIQRAAEVHLKERRTLILVPRETPLSLVALRNMVQVTQAGAVVLPASPGFYHRPRSIDDLVDFIVGRICDHLGLENDLIRRWGGDRPRDPGSINPPRSEA